MIRDGKDHEVCPGTKRAECRKVHGPALFLRPVFCSARAGDIPAGKLWERGKGGGDPPLVSAVHNRKVRANSEEGVNEKGCDVEGEIHDSATASAVPGNPQVCIRATLGDHRRASKACGNSYIKKININLKMHIYIFTCTYSVL